MIIVKKETLRFSDRETQCLEMTLMLMENVVDNATNPNLINTAERIVEDLRYVFTEFIEEDEE